MDYKGIAPLLKEFEILIWDPVMIIIQIYYQVEMNRMIALVGQLVDRKP